MSQSRKFDGIVCIGGEDWWYHNRGHYDMQMMRELSKVTPVLYVNSIGMRVPSVREGSVLLKRIGRKLGSLFRGLSRIREGFTVFSPVMVPGKLGRAVSKAGLGFQIRMAAKRTGVRRPLVWVACPPGAAFLEDLRPVGVIYQRTDRFEEFPRVDREEIAGYDRKLKSVADLTLFCSSLLFKEEGERCRDALFVDHGVDFDRFRSAGEIAGRDPIEMREIQRPRVGFVGGIDAHTFDPDLFLRMASELSDVQFVLVGGCSLPEGWCVLPNVHFLGRKPYDEVPEYMAACDVLIMPWNRNEWIKACNPVKLKEYLAVGRTVVTTPFDELGRYNGFVRRAEDAESFSEAIRSALEAPDDPETLRNRVKSETWEKKALEVLERLRELGMQPNQD